MDSPSIRIPPTDDDLISLRGNAIGSGLIPGVRYNLVQILGHGGMSVTFYASRHSPDGQCPVVMKIIRPHLVASYPNAALAVRKESVSLGRLNERTPPTPFVVRLIETGNVTVDQEETILELPWIALEYVHGGIEGTTLSERVQYCVANTGYAFDRMRAARAVECMTQAFTAVHEVHIIHRDMKPDNVLCCGFGGSEILKIADFGIARPAGVAETFGASMLGTVGYAAPEQLQSKSDAPIGEWTDVFGVAATIYFLLTGERYFPSRTPMEYINRVASPSRRSILEAPALAPELRADTHACNAIDAELMRATAIDRRQRPQTVASLNAALGHWLSGSGQRHTISGRLIGSMISHARSVSVDAWDWTVRHRPGKFKEVRSVSWDGDGKCFAATDRGLLFWDGTLWRSAPVDGIPNPKGIRFVQRIAAGRWFVGGDGAMMATYTADGIEGITYGPDTSICYSHFSGDTADLGVVVGQAPNCSPVLYALAGRWWLKPYTLAGVRYVSSIARIDERRWLITGESIDGSGFAGLYSPLDWSIEVIRTHGADIFRACAAHHDRRAGLAVSANGTIVFCSEQGQQLEHLPHRPLLSAAAIDAAGRGWAGGIGRLWQRNLTEQAPANWESVWDERAWNIPIASIFADVSQVIALTMDGGVLEGRQVDLQLEAC